MKPKTLVWVAIALVVVIIAGWNLMKPAGGGITNVDVAGAKEAITQGAKIVDVRTAGEFQLGRIPGAVNVPLDQLEAQAASWDKSATYLIYCATGSRSATAVDIMKTQGFTSIRHLAAGIQSWSDPLETGEVSEASSHGQRIATDGLPVMVEFFTDS